MKAQELKRILHTHLGGLLDEKISTAREMLATIEESKASETKSSAGDKHETGRAMLQREEAQNRTQLAKALKLKNTLSQLSFDTSTSSVEFGSLVTTDQGVYYLSIGQGKIEIEGNEYIAISPVSPLGQVLLNKEVGEKAIFSKKQYIVIQID